MKFPQLSDEYKDLKSYSQKWSLTYGPIYSRRIGLSLGVNLLGSKDKACSYNCPYCELGLTTVKMNQVKEKILFPSLEEIDLAVRSDLLKIVSAGKKLDALSIVGNGEPTMYPKFPEAVDVLIKARNDVASESSISLFTNGSTFNDKKIIKAVNLLDQVMIKLDAGNDEVLKKINDPLVKTNTEKIIKNIKKIKSVTIQSCFVQGVVDNTLDEHVEEWIELVGIIQPKEVHVYTLDRVPAISGLKKVDEDTLDVIAQKVKRRTGVKAFAF